jgi:hypothetical protein
MPFDFRHSSDIFEIISKKGTPQYKSLKKPFEPRLGQKAFLWVNSNPHFLNSASRQFCLIGGKGHL